MSDPKKVALFADVENVYLGLRSMYNRELSPELLVEKAKARGDLERAMAFADWKELPEGLADKFKAAGYETVQVDRLVARYEQQAPRGREGHGPGRDALRSGRDPHREARGRDGRDRLGRSLARP